MAGEQLSLGSKWVEVWSNATSPSPPPPPKRDWVLCLMIAAMVVVLLLGLVGIPAALVYALLV